MNFDKNALSQLINLDDEALAAVLSKIASEAGVGDRSPKISPADAARIRSLLASADESDISRFLDGFAGGKRNG